MHECCGESQSIYLRWKQLSHIAVSHSGVQSKLSASCLWSRCVTLCFWRAVNLIVHIFTSVHVETSVKKGAVAKAFVCVFVDYSPKITQSIQPLNSYTFINASNHKDVVCAGELT